MRSSLKLLTKLRYFRSGLYFMTFGTNDFVVPLFVLGHTLEQVQSSISNISDAMVANTEVRHNTLSSFFQVSHGSFGDIARLPLGWFAGALRARSTDIDGVQHTTTGVLPSLLGVIKDTQHVNSGYIWVPCYFKCSYRGHKHFNSDWSSGAPSQAPRCNYHLCRPIQGSAKSYQKRYIIR